MNNYDTDGAAAKAPTPEEVCAHAEYFIALQKQLDTIVKRNVTAAHERQKNHYEAKYQQGCYEMGQVVLVENMKKLCKKCDKAKPNWTGQYDIPECVVKNNYHLRRSGNHQLLKSVFKRLSLKLFNERGNLYYSCKPRQSKEVVYIQVYAICISIHYILLYIIIHAIEQYILNANHSKHAALFLPRDQI